MVERFFHALQPTRQQVMVQLCYLERDFLMKTWSLFSSTQQVSAFYQSGRIVK